jgi:hypothetical protein
MRRTSRWRAALHVLYWVLIIAASLGAYYFVEPYAKELLSTYQELRGNLDTARNAVGDFSKLIR